MARQYATGYFLSKAREAEKEGEVQEAMDLYNQVVKNDPVEAYAYNRLMVTFWHYSISPMCIINFFWANNR
jgi:hypothetical protein